MSALARIVFLVWLLAVAGCVSGGEDALAPKAEPTPARSPAPLPIDPAASPVSFRWLSNDAVLVSPETGTQRLAGFGNYVARAAKSFPRARLSVWDDEGAWRRVAGGAQAESDRSARPRAEYVKESDPEPRESFAVFDADGDIAYERDFRNWPLTDLDVPP